MGVADKRRTILAIVQTDVTFERARAADGGRDVWVGKCIHCRSKLVIREDGEPLGPATIEHIRARSQGGTDDIDNLALACARCNHGKGVRHDAKKRPDARALEITERLLAERRARWRDPPA
ncbi:MAG: HNH endonuclease [Myxococcales bacterium]|nr:HNH endonuclease [Myxococcales bacterium]